MTQPFISIIIPVRDEAKRLPLTLVDIDRYLAGAGYSAEVIVVNDGSTDATPGIVERFAQLMPNLRTIGDKNNHGKGWAVRQGMLSGRGHLRLFMDADNAVSLDHLEQALPYFKNGADIVIGSRTVPGAKLDPPQPIWKRALGKAGNLVIQATVAPGIWDTQCGFKVFTGEAAERIFGLAKLDGWGFDAEIIALARAAELKLKEFPVHWIGDPRSTVHGPDYLSTFTDVLLTKWRLSRRRYNI
ncbi:glycosyltransferase family 2 protein [Patescibacteria group bacterium]|nr:glycosyltransferase family 2 protein [Patescibacteria group bacterium]